LDKERDNLAEGISLWVPSPRISATAVYESDERAFTHHFIGDRYTSLGCESFHGHQIPAPPITDNGGRAQFVRSGSKVTKSASASAHPLYSTADISQLS
jgi:hypothetical protein